MSAGNKLQYNNICGRFQKFCTLYFFSLKMNLFYKIHLQAFNVICIVLYHSSPTFWQILYSCQDAFVVDRSNYLGHLIRHLLNASGAFPTKWFLQFLEQVKVWWALVRTVRQVVKHSPFILFQNFRYCTRREAVLYCAKWGHRLWTWQTFFGKSLDAKHLAETFCSMPLLQWTPEALCLLLSLDYPCKPHIKHYEFQLGFFLAKFQF